MLSKAPIYLFIGLCAATTLLSSCESQSQKPAATTTAPAATPAVPAAATAATYECPMQCAGSQSDKPGKCPVCEMELEKKS